MRRRHLAYGGAWLVLILVVAGVACWLFREQPMGVSIGVHSYERQADHLYASLALTNTGAASLAVPLRFGCEVISVGELTNYVVNTPYSVYLAPGAWVILSNRLWRVSVPSGTSAWQVKIGIRKMAGRERFADALRQSGLVKPRMVSRLSRLAGRPVKEAEDELHECTSGWFEVPAPKKAE